MDSQRHRTRREKTILPGPLDEPRRRRRPRDFATRALILGLLGRIRDGAIIVTEPGGRRHLCGRPVAGETVPEVVVHSPAAWGAVAVEGGAGLGRAYFSGWWSCPTLDDLTMFLRVVERNLELLERPGAIGRHIAVPLRRHLIRPSERPGKLDVDRRNIHAHYDLGNEFFSGFLDPTMTYSSAIFASSSTSLEEAQIAKLERVCRKLGLSAADHVLEIGTGWGSFAILAASRYGCKVTTTTISEHQFELASARVREQGLEDLVTVLDRDYREMTGTYDKVVSIEMIEAVDWKQYDTFFRTCSELLAPNGAMALQSIVIADHLFERAKLNEDFVKRYVFPGSCIPSIRAIIDSTSTVTDLRLVALDDIGQHYAETLRRWRRAFGARPVGPGDPAADESFRRLFEYYLCYSEAGFAERRIGDVQCVFVKPEWRAPGLAWPLS